MIKKCDCDCSYLAHVYENLWDESRDNYIRLSKVFIEMKKILRERYLKEDEFNCLMKDAFEQSNK